MDEDNSIGKVIAGSDSFEVKYTSSLGKLPDLITGTDLLTGTSRVTKLRPTSISSYGVGADPYEMTFHDAEEFLKRNRPIINKSAPVKNYFEFKEENREEIKKSWMDFFKENGNAPKLNKIRIKSKQDGVDKKLTIDKVMTSILELLEKNCGNFIVTGSVALYLQGKLSRKQFSDVDLISFSDVEYDDDMTRWKGAEYPKTKNLGEQEQFIFNGMMVDVFKMPPDTKIDVVEVNWNGNVFQCQDYKGIIMAKLNMVLPKMKDSEELLKTCFEINFK